MSSVEEEELRLLELPELKSLTFSHLGKGVLSPVIDQRPCPICWIIVTVGATESLYAINHGKLIKSSIQHVLDCYKEVYKHQASKKEDANGCFENPLREGFQFIKDNGVHRDDVYPFVYKRENCRCKEIESKRMKIEGFERIKNNPKQIEELVFQQPIVAAMTVYYDFFEIRKEVYCPPKEKKPVIRTNLQGDKVTVRHAILIIGYGIEKGISYYLVKGSHGKEWGIKGFAKISTHIVSVFYRPINPFLV